MGVAVVGSGMIGGFQANASCALPDAYVAGFYDQVAELAKRRAEEFDARVYGSLEELLSDPRVHIVSICTPSGAHLEPAVAAAAARKHVMVEKPVEITPDRVDQIVAACEKTGVTLGAIFPRRFLDTTRVLKQAIDAG